VLLFFKKIEIGLIYYVSMSELELELDCIYSLINFSSIDKKNQQQIHTYSFTAKKKNYCFICSRFFTHKGNYVVHMKTHTGKKNYHCDYCFRSFYRKQNCNTHTETHFNIRNWACNSCGKSFTRKSNLKRHYNSCVFKYSRFVKK